MLPGKSISEQAISLQNLICCSTDKKEQHETVSSELLPQKKNPTALILL